MERKVLESGRPAETEVFERHAPYVAQAPHGGLTISSPFQAHDGSASRGERSTCKAEEKVPTIRQRESLDEVVH